MDDRAKLQRTDTIKQPRVFQDTISGEPWALWYQGQKICVNLDATPQTATLGKANLEYWAKREKYELGNHTDVDWQATGQAMSKASIARCHWVSKHLSDFCGTSKLMHR
jgi:hypothetical protein